MLRKIPSENPSDKRFASQKTILAYMKPPLSEVEKDLNESIPTCFITFVSTNEDQISEASIYIILLRGFQIRLYFLSAVGNVRFVFHFAY